LAHRFALTLLAVAAPATLLAFCIGTNPGIWVAALAGGAVFPAALIALGASRDGRLGGLKWPLLFLGLLLAIGLIAAIGWPGGGPDVLGLPAATAIMIFVLIPVPLVLLGGIFAATFDRWFLRPEDLDRVRAAKLPGDLPSIGEEG
jgi:hypothetical protein